MSLLSAFLSAVKSEIDWAISSLALAETAADSQPAEAPADDAKQAPDANAAHSEAKSEVTSIVTTQEDSAPHHHAPASLAAEQNYLHHIAYNTDDGAEAGSKGVLLSSGEVDLPAPPHSDVAPINVDATENAGGPAHASPLGDIDTGNAIFQFASINAQRGGAGGGGGGGGTPPPDYNTSGPLQITLHFDASVAKAPQAFVDDMKAVADFFAGHYNDPTHITINVGFGEVAGFHIGSAALGESITNLTAVSSYANLRSALVSDGGADVHTLLPADDPITRKHIWVLSTADAKALGLLASNASVDGSVGFSGTDGTFDYTSGHTPPSGQYDFLSVAAHEISEVMGRMLFVGGSKEYTAFDLFHFADSDNTHIYSGTTPGYFSIDGGATLHEFNTNPSGDFGDWASGATADSFDAAGGAGSLAPVTEIDLEAMDAIGWNRVASSLTIP
jgi:hypothetical protein